MYWDQPTKDWLLGFIEEAKQGEDEDAAEAVAIQQQKRDLYWKCIQDYDDYILEELSNLSPSQQSQLREQNKEGCALYLR